MSDLPPDQQPPEHSPFDPPTYPAPPPSNLPPTPPAYQPPPPYQPPAGQYPAPPGQFTPPSADPPGAPGQMPPPIIPARAVAGAGGASLMFQFTGPAGWSVLLGLVGIIVPFVFSRIFFFLPLIGLLSGVQAIRRGRMIGGIVGIVLNVIAGIITVIGLVAG